MILRTSSIRHARSFAQEKANEEHETYIIKYSSMRRLYYVLPENQKPQDNDIVEAEIVDTYENY